MHDKRGLTILTEERVGESGHTAVREEEREGGREGGREEGGRERERGRGREREGRGGGGGREGQVRWR